MLSRIADSLYWLNRYMERIDGILRVASVHSNLSLDTDVTRNITWKPVLEMFTTLNGDEINSLENESLLVLKTLLIKTGNGNSVKILVNKSRENARGIQDHITKELWEQVNAMYHLVNDTSVLTRIDGYQGREILELFKKQCVLYTGLTEITMSRGMGWQFMNMGKFIERCLQTITLVEKNLQLLAEGSKEINDIIHWRYLLLSVSGYEQHLKTYHTPNVNRNVMHQVLLNENFSRSVIYSLGKIDFSLKYITRKNNHEETSNLLRHFGRLHSKIKYMELQNFNNKTIQPFLEETKFELLEFSTRMAQHFFSYS
jgi:uncharacterized alpha-E superfamily protein